MDDLEEIIESPLDDGDIRYYLPSAKVMTYSELKKHNSIETLLSKKPDYAFLLYQSSPSNGHWTVITRDKYNNINYFDSYGNKIDHPLRWTGLDTRKKLGEEAPMLSMLMNKTQLPVYYNNVDYQGDGSDINTCGRHCVFYVLNMLKNNMTLAQYYEYMKKMSKKYKLNYDEIVSEFITKI